MNELLYLLNSIHPLTEELREHLIDVLIWRDLLPGQHLLKVGQVCENVYFVNEGLFRSYYFNKKGVEVNKWFMTKGDVVFAVRSFLKQIPSTEYIQALQPSTVGYISHLELESIYEKHLTFNIHGRKLTQEYYMRSEEREEIMRMDDASDRYDYLLDHFSGLVNAVPDKDLASFLRMTPIWLSNLRNNRMKRGKRN
jgi:CRP-like cAMP-binding protein